MASHEPAPQPTGLLRLGIELREGRSVATRQFHQGALRVLRPHRFDPWQVCYTVVNPGGGYLGGDTYHLEVDVADGAAALVTSQAATKVYRTPTAPARQFADLAVAPDGLLEFLPDQLILYRDADYVQQTAAVVDPAGTLVLSDVVTPGWSPDGEPFRYRSGRLRTRVERPDGELVLLDNLLLDPGRQAVSGLGVLDGHSHVGSLLVVDRRADQDVLDLVRECLAGRPGLRAGSTLAPGPSLVVRILGGDTESVQSALRAVTSELRARWFGLPELDPRTR